MNRILATTLAGWIACSSLPAAELGASSAGLFRAIRDGDSTGVRTSLKAGADLRSRNEAGDTPLMSAALYADTAILDLLLEAGAEVNATNQAGASALMRASTFHDKARRLVEAGADVAARSVMGNTPLILAARQNGNAATVKLLLDRGASANATNAFGASALLAAVAAEDPETTRLLLDHGADVNAIPAMTVDGFIWGGGRSALGWAAFRGHEAQVELLLKRGARTDVVAITGSALTQAAWAGHAGVARLLLDAGAPVDRRDPMANYTALHWAASSEHRSPALVELLLARGADANAEGGEPVDNYLGVPQTPLMLALRRGDTPIVSALRKAGARATTAPERRSPSDGTGAVAVSPSPSAAIQRALPALVKTAEESVPTFLRHASRQDCISCHQQQLPLAAISLAASRRFAVDPIVISHQLDLLTRFLSSQPITLADSRFTGLEASLQSTFHPEPAISAGYATLDFQLARRPAGTVTDALVHQLTTLQSPDGRWSWNIPRPPIQASDITATAQALHAIRTYPIPARRGELKERVDRARAWLAKTPAETNEERAHQLLGLATVGEEASTLKRLAEELIGQQRPDGGWGQLAGLESDAYGTGQSLYALTEAARLPADHPAVRRGLDFLLRTQHADGTWRVRTRTHPFQPPMDAGFPHGRDAWISATGTSWAVMALAASLDPAHVMPTPSAISEKAAAAPAIAAAAHDGPIRPVEFVPDIQPLLEHSCVPCHGGDRPKGGYLVTDRGSLLKGGNRGEPVAVPGKPEASHLMRLVRDEVEDLEMPPVAKRRDYPALTKEETARLGAWIHQGAPWPDGLTLRRAAK